MDSAGWQRDDAGFRDPRFAGDGDAGRSASERPADAGRDAQHDEGAPRPDEYDPSGGYSDDRSHRHGAVAFRGAGASSRQGAADDAGEAGEAGEGGRGRDGGMPGRTGGTSAGTGPVSSQPAAGTSGRGKGPKNFTRGDERILEDVCHRLEDSDVDASGIEVRVTNGEVTLEGTVADGGAKREVEDLVHDTRGVKQCHNLLRLGHPAGYAG